MTFLRIFQQAYIHKQILNKDYTIFPAVSVKIILEF